MTDLAIRGPLLVFGGPYSNRHALEALLRRARAMGFGPGDMLCTGDVVAYAADAAATLDLMIASGIPTVMGNCEESLAEGADGCGCGFAEGTACDLLSRGWFAHARRQVDARHRAWMGSLPRAIGVRLGGRRLLAVHGAPGAMSRFVFASTPERELAAMAEATGADGILAGHCGLPFTRVAAGRLWHNAGAIGMPADDGTPRTWFSVLAPEDGGIRVTHHALEHDHRAAAAAMLAAGLAEGYANALETGHWPSADVLPPAERAARGQPIAPAGVLWR